LPKIFDTQDLAAQVDVLRKHLRHWYSMHGPVPAELAADHDIGYEAAEADRLQKVAEEAEAHAKAMREAADAPKPAQPSAVELAEQRAKAAREAAAQFGGGSGIGEPPFKASSREPKA